MRPLSFPSARQRLLLVFLLSALLMACSFVFPSSGTAYSVIYDGNGNTSGAVPVDSASYASGSTVTVLGNTGSLARSGYIFSGWLIGTTGSSLYSAGDSFTMPSSKVTLYACWTLSGSSSASILREDFEDSSLVSGFDSEDLNSNDSNKAVTFPCATFAKNGVNSLEIDRTKTGSEANVRYAGGATKKAYGFWFRFSGALPEGKTAYVSIMFTSAWKNGANFYLQRSGAKYYLLFTGDDVQKASQPVAADTWYWCSAAYYAGAVSSFLIADAKGTTLNSGDFTATGVGLQECAVGGVDEAYSGFVTYYDDFCVDLKPSGLIPPPLKD